MAGIPPEVHCVSNLGSRMKMDVQRRSFRNAHGTAMAMACRCRRYGTLPRAPLPLPRAVFDLLYMLIGYGHEDPETARKLDPPDDFFRVRMVSSCHPFRRPACSRFFTPYTERHNMMHIDKVTLTRHVAGS